MCPSPIDPELLRLSHAGGHFSNEEGSFESSIEATRAVTQYALDLISEKRRRPANDIMTEVLQAEIDGSQLTTEDLAATFWVILTGGTDTTGASATHVLLALTKNPDERREFQQNYEQLAASAVEEMLRWASPLLNFRRTATADAEVSGQRVSAGDNLVLFYLSANRDETVFDDPYRFDVRRSPNPHLAFGGGGPHTCLGAALARVELKILFRELFRLLPDIEVSGEPIYGPSPLLDAITSLPCTFTAVDLGQPG